MEDRNFPDQAVIRLGKGTFERIDKVLKPRENRSVFMRDSIDLKLKLRERGRGEK